MTARRIARSVALAVAASLVAVLLSGCVPSGVAGTTTVGADGFTVSASGVRVQGPSGVAEQGTTVKLDLVEAPIPSHVAEFATSSGMGVSLTLDGGNVQPSLPITIEFTLDEQTDPANLFVLGEEATTGSGVAFVESVWDQERSVLTATVDHLSWFAPVTVDSKSLGERFGEWMNQALGTRSAAPSCSGQGSSLTFTTVGDADNVAWPCASVTSSGIQWSLQSNSPLVWEVLTYPETKYEPITALTAAGLATAVVAGRMGDLLEGDAVIIPGETLKGSFDKGTAALIEVRVAPGLSQISTVMFGLSMILPEKVMKVIGEGECLAGVLRSATGTPSGETLRLILSCAGAAVGGVAGAFLGILLSGPALLSGQVEGLVREIARTNLVQYVLSVRNDTQVNALPRGGVWLHKLPQEISPRDGDADIATVPVAEGNVIFANSTNLWVGCDGSKDTATYYLDGKYSELSLGLGLQAHTPPGFTAKIVVRAGETLHEWDMTRGTIVDRQTIDIRGVRSIPVTAATTDDCGAADKGYGALLDAYVR